MAKHKQLGREISGCVPNIFAAAFIILFLQIYPLDIGGGSQGEYTMWGASVDLPRRVSYRI